MKFDVGSINGKISNSGVSRISTLKYLNFYRRLNTLLKIEIILI